MLAQDLAPALVPSHEVTALHHSECDITDESALRPLFKSLRPDVVINCAAYSDVDGCERDPQRASEVNGSGPGNLARAAEAIGARVFHIGTDYVFDGKKRAPYEEEDAPNPISAYGRSKLEGERAVFANGSGRQRHLVIRTSWLYGAHRTNFVDKIIEGAQSRPRMDVVQDQVSCLTWTRHLAKKIAELVSKRVTGILHIAGSGECTRYDIARMLVERLSHPVSITPITWESLNLPAKRPAYSAMRSGRLGEVGLRALPDWKSALDEYISVRPSIATAMKTS